MERRSSSSGTGVVFRLRNSLITDCTTFEADAQRGAGVDGEASGVAVRIEIAVDGVGQALAFTNVLEQARTHTAAEQGVEDVAGVALLMRDGMRGHAEAELHLLQRLLVAQDDARESLGRGRVEAVFRGLHVFEVSGDQFDEVVVIEIAGGRYDDVAGGEAVAVGVDDRFALEALHGFFGAQDRLAQGMILEKILGEDFVDEVVRIIFVHFDFFEDHAAFAGDVGGIKIGVQNQVAENVERGRDVFVEHLDVEADAFLGR